MKLGKKWSDLSSALHLFSLLFVFQSPPLFCLSFESPADSVSVCCMLPWLFLEPDALCCLPVRPTNSGCSVCVCYCICGWVFFVHMRETENDIGKVERDSEFYVCFVVCFTFFFILISLSGSQQPPGGFRAAPGLSGGQEDQGIECRHKVDILIACQLHQVFLKDHSQNTVKKRLINSYICLLPRRASTLSSAVSSLSSTGMSFSRMDEKEKQQALEEEQARLQALKVTKVILCNTKSPVNQGVRLGAVAAERLAPAGLIVTVVTFSCLSYSHSSSSQLLESSNVTGFIRIAFFICGRICIWSYNICICTLLFVLQ